MSTWHGRVEALWADADRIGDDALLAGMKALVAERPDDPLIASVASQLVELCEGEDTEVARLALRELHAACQAGN